MTANSNLPCPAGALAVAGLRPLALLTTAMLITAALLASVAWAKPPAKSAQRPQTGIPYEGLSPADQKALVGATADVVPRTGKTFKDAELVQVSPGKLPGVLQSIAFKPAEGGSKRNMPAKNLARLVAAGRVLELMPDRRQKNAFLLVDIDQRDAFVNAKLRGQDQMLWPPVTDEARAEAITANKALLAKIDSAVSERKFQLTETKYYLFSTDLPEATLAPVIADLDNMYLTLGQKFGVFAGENIWHGKAMVAVFSTQKGFVNFEKIVMDLKDVGENQGIFHRLADGDVMLACYVGDDPDFFISELIHETARGYMFRYRSTVTVPNWITEGVAEWVTGSLRPADKAQRRRQELAVETLRRNGNLSNLFRVRHFNSSWQWGAAGAMTDILLKTDAQAYRQFIQGIKEGQTWEAALLDAFNLTPEELAALYGQQIGVPNLQP